MQNQEPEQLFLSELETLKKSVQKKDAQIKRLQEEHQRELQNIRQTIGKEQEEMKQNILTYMLRDNEMQKKLEQLHINNEVLQTTYEQCYNDSNNKIRTLLDIIDKKEIEIDMLKKTAPKAESQVLIKKEYVDSGKNTAELQAKIRELSQRLSDSREQNRRLQETIEHYQREVRSNQEHLQDQKMKSQDNFRSLQLSNEEHLREARSQIDQLKRDNSKLVQILKGQGDEVNKLKSELASSNKKVDELIRVCENVQKSEAFHEELREELLRAEDRYRTLERNYKLELNALQVQLDEASKYIAKDVKQQQQIDQAHRIGTELKAENDELKKQLKGLRHQMDSLEQNYEAHLEKVRKSNIDLSQREFELQTIIESQKKNFIERENELTQQFNAMSKELERLHASYELLKHKEQDSDFRLRLLKPKPQPKAKLQNTNTSNQGILKETVQIKEKVNLDPRASFVTKFDRNVYMKTTDK